MRIESTTSHAWSLAHRRFPASYQDTTPGGGGGGGAVVRRMPVSYQDLTVAAGGGGGAGGAGDAGGAMEVAAASIAGGQRPAPRCGPEEPPTIGHLG
mmetsp:Transcript_71955/g.160104  ORF Transcript_71955/g.160104 Transcript_71955/m.160104 type:complete len:97 (+) Transcript_71955:509-799(+)